MKKSKTVQFNGAEVQVNELTVEQIDSLMAEQATTITTVEMLLDPNIPISAIVASTGISSASLNGDVSPHEAQQLWQAVEEMNPFLSKMYTRLIAAANMVEVNQKKT